MRHVAHMKACRTYECVMSHLRMSHVAHMNQSCMNESRMTSYSWLIRTWLIHERIAIDESRMRRCEGDTKERFSKNDDFSYDTLSCHDLYVLTHSCVTCDMTHSYVRHDSFMSHVTWLIHKCDVTHSYARRDSFVRVIDISRIPVTEQVDKLWLASHSLSIVIHESRRTYECVTSNIWMWHSRKSPATYTKEWHKRVVSQVMVAEHVQRLLVSRTWK